jgi:hypothetical protein
MTKRLKKVFQKDLCLAFLISSDVFPAIADKLVETFLSFCHAVKSSGELCLRCPFDPQRPTALRHLSTYAPLLSQIRTNILYL